MEEYFEHRWKYDRNAAIDDPQELSMLYQLPVWVQDDIYTDFLWRVFLQKFSGFFRIIKGSKFGITKYKIDGIEYCHSYYTWNDQNYREFMTCLLQNMEPCRYGKNCVIYNELDEFGFIFFMDQGSIAVGIEFNKQQHYAVKYNDKCVVGAFGITFGQRCRYIYRTARENTSGYFIRKQPWLDIMSEYKDVSKSLK